ncbi:anti-sigma factor [Saccharibacillus brassicae]|uniref:Regulator of SigK n=1 Tax=Saccharibacillus brassicae TaxID=2583377 RepID=A0A4Y6V0P2_SACBS|nr:anti-sigma factor [Saccharibacillus brassicae]QDH22320.1 hypothetical protein FFV09_16590 [Saccharibacillus brassicae]
MNERKESMTDWAEAYALGGLDEAEMAEFEAFLHDDVDERRRTAELKDTVGMLALAVKPAAPPTGMKKRILGNVLGSEAPRGGLSAAGDKAAAERETQRLLEQARQNIEVDETRREAQQLGGIDGNGGAGVLGAATGNERSGSRNAADAQRPEDGQALKPAVRGESRHARREQTAARIRSEADAPAETRIGASRARAGRGLWAGVASVMAAAAVLLGIYSSQLRGEMNDMRSDMTAMQQQTADMEQQLAAGTQPAVGAQVARTVALVGSEDSPNATGMAAMVEDQSGMQLVVQAEDLPALSGSEAYQVWLIKDGQPINAGTFQSGSGSGALTYKMQPDEYDMVAITLEPDAEGQQPRGQMVLTGALNG